MIEVDQWLKSPLDATVVMQVHDELVLWRQIGPRHCFATTCENAKRFQPIGAFISGRAAGNNWDEAQ
jgi:hypothetical protein